ncbi:MAG: hypothetical protein M3340_03635, partial [Actinomycetota bacterium]|nr:hypothetical protein [Actinomycetota bacterium]
QAPSLPAREGLDRRPAPPAQSYAADEQNGDLIDLALGAVEGAKYVGLADAEPAGDRSAAQLVALDKPVHRALPSVQLAQAVVDYTPVRSDGGGFLDAIGALVGRNLLEQLANRKLASPPRLPEVLRPEAETGPERAGCAPQTGSAACRAPSPRLGIDPRARPAAGRTTVGVPACGQNVGASALKKLSDLVGSKLLTRDARAPLGGWGELYIREAHRTPQSSLLIIPLARMRRVQFVSEGVESEPSDLEKEFLLGVALPALASTESESRGEVAEAVSLVRA